MIDFVMSNLHFLIPQIVVNAVMYLIAYHIGVHMGRSNPKASRRTDG